MNAIGETPRSSARERLSVRESEVMGCVAEGLTDVEIAAELGCRPKTVQSHRAGAYKKLGARNAAHAVALCLGIVLT